MKQVNVKLKQEAILKAKQYGLTQNLTFQEIMAEALDLYISINIEMSKSINIETTTDSTIYTDEEDTESFYGSFDLGHREFNPDERYRTELDRFDVDPLEMLSEAEWKARLEELKRERGL